MRNDGHDCEACRASMWRREALMVALAIVAASLCTAYQAAGAWLEMRLAPVIENQRIEFAARGPRAACWLWRFDRRRADVAFASADLTMVVGDPPDVIDGTLLIADGGTMRYFLASRTTARVGPGERVLCVDLARARIRRDQAVTIRAAITYQPWHGFWPLRYDLPGLTLPPSE